MLIAFNGYYKWSNTDTGNVIFYTRKIDLFVILSTLYYLNVHVNGSRNKTILYTVAMENRNGIQWENVLKIMILILMKKVIKNLETNDIHDVGSNLNTIHYEKS